MITLLPKNDPFPALNRKPLQRLPDWKRGFRANQRPTAGDLWADRLSTMTWMSR
jgi:hypothetical protein